MRKSFISRENWGNNREKFIFGESTSEYRIRRHRMFVGSKSLIAAQEYYTNFGLVLDVSYWVKARKEYLSVTEEELQTLLTPEEVEARKYLFGSLTLEEAKLYVAGFNLELNKEYWMNCHEYYKSMNAQDCNTSNKYVRVANRLKA